MSDYPNMIIERVDFNLQIGVVIKEGRIAISGTFELFPHVHDLILLGSDFGRKFFYASGKLNISSTLLVNSLLKISILVSVFLF